MSIKLIPTIYVWELVSLAEHLGVVSISSIESRKRIKCLMKEFLDCDISRYTFTWYANGNMGFIHDV